MAVWHSGLFPGTETLGVCNWAMMLMVMVMVMVNVPRLTPPCPGFVFALLSHSVTTHGGKALLLVCVV